MTAHEPHMNLTKRGRTSQKPHKTWTNLTEASQNLTEASQNLTKRLTCNLTRRHRKAFRYITMAPVQPYARHSTLNKCFHWRDLPRNDQLQSD
jgi:hypothetical protein